MFGLSPVHLILILAIALIVVGPGRLPEVGQALGKSIKEFRKAATDVQEATSLTGTVTPAPAPAPAAPAPVQAPMQAAPVAVQAAPVAAPIQAAVATEPELVHPVEATASPEASA